MTEENNEFPTTGSEAPQADPAASESVAPAAETAPLEPAAEPQPAEAPANPYGVANAGEQPAAPAHNPYEAATTQPAQPTSPYDAAATTQPVASPAPWEYAQSTPAQTNPYGQPTQPVPQPVAYDPNQPFQQAPAYDPNQPFQQAPVYDPATQQYYAPQGGMPQAYAAPAAPSSGKAMASLLCGIGAIVFSGSVILGIVLGIIAIVLASQYVKSYGKDGKATAGKVTGILGIVLSVLMIFFGIIFGIILFSVIEEQEYDSSYSSSSSSISDSDSDSESSSDSKDSLSDDMDAEEEALSAAAEDLMGSYQNADEATLKEIAEGVDAYFTEITDEKLSDYGVDSMEIAKKMSASLSYDITSVSAYGDYGSVHGAVTSITMSDFFDAFSDAIDEMDGYTEDNQKQALQKAVETMTPSDESMYLDFELNGDEWELEESDYNSPLAMFFGIYLW